MATYWGILDDNSLTPEQKAAQIQAIGEAERKQINTDNLKAKGRIGLGATVQGLSALPIFNIPYVGTGLGGALFEAGNAIAEGKSGADIAKDAGKGFAIGETVGAIPYVGKVASKTKAGQAVGNQASKLFDYLANTKAGQKVTEIAPKVEDVLMTDIKAFNPFKQTQTVYHGSPADFNKFDNAYIGTGEGAQAHGYGHYAAKSKDVADNYRKRLKKPDYTVENPDKISLPFGLDTDLIQAEHHGIDKVLQKFDNEIQNYKALKLSDPDNAFAWQEVIDDYVRRGNNLKEYINKNLKVTKNEGQLYKLSIPKDDVMLREDLPFNQQPLKVQEGLRDYFNQNPLQKHERRFFEDIENPDLLETTTGDNLYRQIARNVLRLDKNMKQREANAIATQILQDKGIKGISYNGGIDGEAAVIFNPDDIEIVRKYYNQPSFYELITKQKPFYGGASNALYDSITGE